MLKAAGEVSRSLKVAVHCLTDRRYREFYAQRRITSLPRRAREARKLVARLPRSVQMIAPDELCRPLIDDGIVAVPNLLPATRLPAILKHFKPLLARDTHRPQLQPFLLQDAPAGVRLAEYSASDTLSAPHLMQVANDPAVLAIVEHYLGAKPTLAAMRAWWSLPCQGAPERMQLFHRDVDDLRFVKLFVYLTDVDEQSGPHVYVAGSHRQSFLTKIRRYSEGEVEIAAGKDAIRTITGTAGTAFLADTYGIHRGLPPVSKPRLIFQPLYATRPLIYGPRRPLRSAREDEAGLDPYVNRVFLRF